MKKEIFTVQHCGSQTSGVYRHDGNEQANFTEVVFIDSGTDHNWISEGVVERLVLRRNDTDIMEYAVLDCTYQRTECTGSVSALWYSRRDGQYQGKPIGTTMYIKKDLPFDMIFGRRFSAAQGLMR